MGYEKSPAGIRHQAGGHQDVPSGERAEAAAPCISDRGLRHRAAPGNAGPGAVDLSGNAGLRSWHHEAEPDPV